MGFLDHLEEMRLTVGRCVVAFAVACALVGAFLTQFADLLLWPFTFATRNTELLMSGLVNTSILGVFSVVFYLIFGGGFALSLPFMLYFAARFVAPGLTPAELRLLRPACLGAIALFVLGALFSYFILAPAALRASIVFNNMLGFTPLWTAASYYSLITWMVLGVGMAFQFPLVLLILIYLGVLSVHQLVAFRRYSIVVFLCLCAAITPTTDPVTFIILTIPLSLLYELAIILGRRVQAVR
jgi:sec-independent protein translocase protein TatC